MMFTRTITTFEAKAYRLFLEDGTPKVEELGKAVFMGTAANRTDARKALADAGYAIPKGATIEITPVEEVVYGCTIEDFMSVAHPVERKPKAER